MSENRTARIIGTTLDAEGMQYEQKGNQYIIKDGFGKNAVQIIPTKNSIDLSECYDGSRHDETVRRTLELIIVELGREAGAITN